MVPPPAPQAPERRAAPNQKKRTVIRREGYVSGSVFRPICAPRSDRVSVGWSLRSAGLVRAPHSASGVASSPLVTTVRKSARAWSESDSLIRLVTIPFVDRTQSQATGTRSAISRVRVPHLAPRLSQAAPPQTANSKLPSSSTQTLSPSRHRPDHDSQFSSVQFSSRLWDV